MKLPNCRAMLRAMTARHTAAIHPESEKKIANITATVATTLMAPVDVLVRKPNGNRPICSESLTRIP